LEEDVFSRLDWEEDRRMGLLEERQLRSNDFLEWM
jgi:hypothetical protein